MPFSFSGLKSCGSFGQHGIPSNMMRFFSGNGSVVVPFFTFSARSIASCSNASAVSTLPRAVTISAMWLKRSKPDIGAGLYCRKSQTLSHADAERFAFAHACSNFFSSNFLPEICSSCLIAASNCARTYLTLESSTSTSLLYGMSIMMSGMLWMRAMFSYHFVMQLQMLLQQRTKSGMGIRF